jgi:predicted Zn-dependent protease
MSEATLPHPAGFHLKAAVGWLELGSSADARAELKAIGREHGDHPDVLEVWWQIYVDEKKWSAALGMAEKLVAAVPDRPESWIQQSFALHEMARTADAYERLVKVVDRFPETYVIPYNLACYQCQLGNRVAALNWLKRAVKVADPKTIRSMALDDPDLQPLRDELARLD